MSNYQSKIALAYIDRGLSPIPVKFQSKVPMVKSWPSFTITKDTCRNYFDSEPTNIGVLTGTASGGLVDVDVDDIDALRFTSHFLPKTSCIFGRKSKPRSHWIYRVPKADSLETFASDGMIVEVRGENHYTLFPGSVHPSGESVEFEDSDNCNPGTSTWQALKNAARMVAMATILFKRWQPGIRHELALSTTALLARHGWSVEDVQTLIRAVATEADDEELRDRVLCVETTFERYNRGEAISSEARFEQLLGPAVAESFISWCGSKRTDPPAIIPQFRSDVIADISNDASAADSFAAKFDGHLIYSSGSWYRRRNQVFEPISDEIVQGMAKDFFQEQVAKGGMGPFDVSALKKYLTKSRINAAIELSRSRLRVPGSLIDNNAELVGCGDGSLLDYRADKRNGGSEAYVTRTLGASVDPSASCPMWMSFLNRIFDNDASLIDFVRRAVGYSLTGSVQEQCLFILVGTGANGKSTFLRILHHLFGDYAGSIPIQTLMNQKFGTQQTNDLASLLGKRFVTASEGERDQHLAEAKIKMMTGGDRISCRFMYKDFFEFDPQFKLWLATNNLPTISGTDDAIWRRIRVVRFPVTIPADEQDKALPNRLLGELPGVLNWALQGLEDWRQHGLNPPSSVLQSTGRYREDNDSIGQWIDAACVLEPNARATMKDLHYSYKEWCENSGVDALSNTCFGKDLTKRGFENIRTRTGNGRRGLAIRTTEPTL